MVRSFDRAALPSGTLDRVLDAARRAPSAGFSQGLELVVMEGPSQTGRYWDATVPDPAARGRFPWGGLGRAPVLVVVVVSPAAYQARYAEPDKVGRGGPGRWPVPYWLVDGGMGVMAMLLAAVDEGLGAAFFSTFERTGAVRALLGVPEGHLILGTLALGHPAPDRPGRSAGRRRRPLHEVVHRGHW